MRRYAGAFEPALVSVADAEQVVGLAGSIEGVAATLKALAGARVAEGGAWKRSGERSAAHHLARTTGTSVAQAVDAIETGRRLEHLPVVAAAARSGAVSAQQAAALADAAAADPSAERRLVETARKTSLADLRTECARTRAAAAPDPEARRAAIHRGRYLRSYTDAEGAWNLRVRDNPEVGAQVMAALEPRRDRLFRAARKEGRREPLEAYAADALAELACAGPSAKKRAGAKVLVRVDLPALLRGRPTEGEVCAVAGYGPVTVSAVRELLETGDPFLAAVVTNGEAVVGVAHLGRRPNVRQQTALEWLSPECSVLGCPSVSFLETDHRVEWSKSHLTVLDLLDRMCTHHHHLKTRENWALVAATASGPSCHQTIPATRRTPMGRPPTEGAMTSAPARRRTRDGTQGGARQKKEARPDETPRCQHVREPRRSDAGSGRPRGGPQRGVHPRRLVGGLLGRPHG
ncbi:MAG TPA: DUF222 domain-containing protein, partial [Acidimicrobiales bacterium]|nr:DUF222 domain-containing protein [Acidimicrobiales bacterium]